MDDVKQFELIACEIDGAPVKPVAEMAPEVAENSAQCATFFAKLGFTPPWVGYVAVANGAAVGNGGFGGAPRDGRVEISYFTAPAFEGRGIASRTAERLVAIARAEAPSITVIAKTLPEQNASTRILARLGFQHAGDTSDHEIEVAWLWELPPVSR